MLVCSRTLRLSLSVHKPNQVNLRTSTSPLLHPCITLTECSSVLQSNHIAFIHGLSGSIAQWCSMTSNQNPRISLCTKTGGQPSSTITSRPEQLTATAACATTHLPIKQATPLQMHLNRWVLTHCWSFSYAADFLSADDEFNTRLSRNALKSRSEG